MRKFNKRIVQVLAPYGSWPHPKGNQIVDEDSADLMIAASRRLFGKPDIPIYIGHPDEDCADCRDKRVGIVDRISKTKNGIIVETLYDEKTFAQIACGKIKAMSPRWEMKSLGGDDYRPMRLVSVGLTNAPNISGSGRVIDALGAPAEAQCRLKSRLCQAGENARQLQKRTQRAGENLRQIARSMREIQIEKRLEKIESPSAEALRKPQKPRRRLEEFSAMARKLSAETGQPYTKAFAKIRKTNTKCA